MASPVRHAVLANMDADLKAKLAENGMEVATSTPDELKRLITQDIKVHAELVRPAGGEICCLMRSFLRHSVASRTCMIAFSPLPGPAMPPLPRSTHLVRRVDRR